MPQCSVPSCDKVAHARGLCPMHYQRLRTRGAIGDAQPERTFHAGATCAVGGCGQPRRKRAWCAAHYAQWQRTGEVRPFTYKWAKRQDCIVCGLPSDVHRRFCTNACRATWVTYSGAVPATVTCIQCGYAITLTRPGERRRRADIRICSHCRTGLRKHALSVGQLVRRDGTDCGICGKAVDLTLTAPNPDRASVDHIIPTALGGANIAENLQLAHLRCNSGKQHRLRPIGAVI